jgi:glutamate N-acetyltransferase / amino-acid N-acetyltransferase
MSITTVKQGGVTSAAGFVAGTAEAAIKKPGRPDVALVVSERPCTAAAVFTQNQVVAAPVIVDRETMAGHAHHIRAVVANAGNANACTGDLGLANAREMQRVTAIALDCQPEQILVLSTGVIGVQLPMERLAQGIGQAAQQLDAAHGSAAARAIMTTDTVAKETAVGVQLSGGTVTIGGMAKGSGMIHPNMATMLAVLTTDALIGAERLQGMLVTAVASSFNRISVDGDTSTNDTVLLLANGASGVAPATKEDAALFSQALAQLCLHLAHQIVRDGEGATKFVTLHVSGATSDEEAHRVAETIVTSPLVKTAFAGSDANWGRILAAAGRAGVKFKQNRVGLWIGRGAVDGNHYSLFSEQYSEFGIPFSVDSEAVQLVAEGTPTAYAEADAAAIFAEAEFVIGLDLGEGSGQATMWTTDLSHDYVSINADYRT